MDIAVRIVERGCERMQEHHWKPPTEKSQVTQRCRAENEQLGKGHSCGAAEARKIIAAEEHDG